MLLSMWHMSFFRTNECLNIFVATISTKDLYEWIYSFKIFKYLCYQWWANMMQLVWNNYSNIFGCPRIEWMNVKVYLNAQELTKPISKYIWMPKNGPNGFLKTDRMNIGIYSDRGKATNMNNICKLFFRIFEHSNMFVLTNTGKTDQNCSQIVTIGQKW